LSKIAISVAEEAERETVFLREGSVLLGLVVRDAEDFDPELLEVIPAVPQLGGFQCSTGGVGLGVEEEQKRLSFEVRARDRGTVMGRKLEFDEGFTDRNHVVLSFAVAVRGDHHDQQANDQQSGIPRSVHYDGATSKRMASIPFGPRLDRAIKDG
jgi:hypothetical protein